MLTLWSWPLEMLLHMLTRGSSKCYLLLQWRRHDWLNVYTILTRFPDKILRLLTRVLSLPPGWTPWCSSSAWRTRSVSRRSITTFCACPATGTRLRCPWCWWARRVSHNPPVLCFSIIKHHPHTNLSQPPALRCSRYTRKTPVSTSSRFPKNMLNMTSCVLLSLSPLSRCHQCHQPASNRWRPCPQALQRLEALHLLRDLLHVWPQCGESLPGWWDTQM